MSRTAVQEFSRALRQNGVVRSIAILRRDGDRPALAVSTFRGSRILTRVLLFAGPEIELLSCAVRCARGPEFIGSQVAGAVSHGDLRLWILTRSDGVRPPAVLLARSTPGGGRVGRPIAICGAELDALEAALEEFQRIAAPRRLAIA